ARSVAGNRSAASAVGRRGGAGFPFRRRIGYRGKKNSGGRRLTGKARQGAGIAAALAGLLLAGSAAPQEVALAAPGASRDLTSSLRAASLTLAALEEGPAPAADILAAARADYGRLLAALYAEGHYSGVVSIRVDG